LVTQTLRPLSLGELLDRAFSYYRRHFVLFVGIAALPNLCGLILQLSQIDATGRNPSVGGTVLWSLAAIVVFLLASTFSQGATVVAVSQIQLDRETNVREAFARIRAQLGELLLLALNIGVRVGLGFLLLVVPGVYLLLKYAVAVPVAILERNGVSASLARSGDLTRGHRGRIFVIYLLFMILAFITSAVWQLPTLFVGRMASGPTTLGHLPVGAQVMALFGRFVTQSLVGPIATIAITLVYYDERVRKEAFDLEHMMRQIDGATPTASPIA
jgi:hypothetical protein